MVGYTLLFPPFYTSGTAFGPDPDPQHWFQVQVIMNHPVLYLSLSERLDPRGITAAS